MKVTISRKHVILLMLCFVAGIAGAQKTDVSGSMDALKGQKKVNVIYDYSEMSVGDYDNEEDYLNERIAERNKEESGAGDRWAKGWVNDRKGRFEPKFEELFNEYADKFGLKGGEYPDAKYTLIVKTTHTEPGWNVGVMRRPAHINAEIWLVETSNMEKDLGVMTMKKVLGRDVWGFDYDTGSRLEEAYALAGKEFAKYLDKKVF